MARRPVRTHLYVHVSLADLATHASGDPAVGEVEKLGPATLDLIKAWLGESRATVQPVLDLNRTDAVDRHDPPVWMRGQVILRDRHCIFPWCGRDARLTRPRPHRPLRPTRRGWSTGPDESPEPRTPVPATPPGQDLHRLDLPTRPRLHLHLDQPPRPELHRRTRRHLPHDRPCPPGPSRGEHARHLTPRSVPGGAHPRPVNQPNPHSDGHFLRLTGIALPVNRGFPRPTGETNLRKRRR